MNKSLRNVIIIISVIIIFGIMYGLKRIDKKVGKIQAKLVSNIELDNELEGFIIESLISSLKIYDVYDENNQPLKMIRAGNNNDGGYVVPEVAFEKADALLGYGISHDASFEEYFANIYKKPSYGFDCSIRSFSSNSKLFTFIDECLGSDKFIYFGVSSGNMSNFPAQIKRLNLEGKKVFIKMDIETAEYQAFNDIYPFSENITGIAIELHMQDFKNVMNALRLLSNLSNDFILVHVHANDAAVSQGEFMKAKNLVGSIPRLTELTFINKSLVKRYELSKDQTHPKPIDMPIDPKHKDVEYEVKLINPVD